MLGTILRLSPEGRPYLSPNVGGGRVLNAAFLPPDTQDTIRHVEGKIPIR